MPPEDDVDVLVARIDERGRAAKEGMDRLAQRVDELEEKNAKHERRLDFLDGVIRGLAIAFMVMTTLAGLAISALLLRH